MYVCMEFKLLGFILDEFVPNVVEYCRKGLSGRSVEVATCQKFASSVCRALHEGLLVSVLIYGSENMVVEREKGFIEYKNIYC